MHYTVIPMGTSKVNSSRADVSWVRSVRYCTPPPNCKKNTNTTATVRKGVMRDDITTFAYLLSFLANVRISYFDFVRHRLPLQPVAIY